LIIGNPFRDMEKESGNEDNQLSSEELKYVRSMIERERVYQAAGKLVRWLAAFFTIVGILIAGVVAANHWIVSFIKDKAGGQ